MVQIVAATYEDGVFKPDQQPALSECTRVRLIVEPTNEATGDSLRDEAWASLKRIWAHSTFDSCGERLTRDELHERH
jgi:predicted DNA-binding antitoxin AbrB/MazE fold protein